MPADRARAKLMCTKMWGRLVKPCTVACGRWSGSVRVDGGISRHIIGMADLEGGRVWHAVDVCFFHSRNTLSETRQFGRAIDAITIQSIRSSAGVTLEAIIHATSGHTYLVADAIPAVKIRRMHHGSCSHITPENHWWTHSGRIYPESSIKLPATPQKGLTDLAGGNERLHAQVFVRLAWIRGASNVGGQSVAYVFVKSTYGDLRYEEFLQTLNWVWAGVANDS